MGVDRVMGVPIEGYFCFGILLLLRFVVVVVAPVVVTGRINRFYTVASAAKSHMCDRYLEILSFDEGDCFVSSHPK